MIDLEEIKKIAIKTAESLEAMTGSAKCISCGIDHRILAEMLDDIKKLQNVLEFMTGKNL